MGLEGWVLVWMDVWVGGQFVKIEMGQSQSIRLISTIGFVAAVQIPRFLINYNYLSMDSTGQLNPICGLRFKILVMIVLIGQTVGADYS